MARFALFILVIPHFAGCATSTPVVAASGWRFALAAVATGTSTDVATTARPTPLASAVAHPPEAPATATAAPSNAPADLAELIAYAALQPRIDALRAMPAPISMGWEAAVVAFAAELRPAVAGLSAADAASANAHPRDIAQAVALTLVPYGSAASRSFREAGDALAIAIQARVLQGAAAPTGAGVAGLDFGGGYAPPVFGSAGGGSGGGSGAAPAPAPTTGIDLVVTAAAGDFKDPAATEAARVGP
jgi:hypothetical protein